MNSLESSSVRLGGLGPLPVIWDRTCVPAVCAGRPSDQAIFFFVPPEPPGPEPSLPEHQSLRGKAIHAIWRGHCPSAMLSSEIRPFSINDQSVCECYIHVGGCQQHRRTRLFDQEARRYIFVLNLLLPVLHSNCIYIYVH